MEKSVEDDISACYFSPTSHIFVRKSDTMTTTAALFAKLRRRDDPLWSKADRIGRLERSFIRRPANRSHHRGRGVGVQDDHASTADCPTSTQARYSYDMRFFRVADVPIRVHQKVAQEPLLSVRAFASPSW